MINSLKTGMKPFGLANLQYAADSLVDIVYLGYAALTIVLNLVLCDGICFSLLKNKFQKKAFLKNTYVKISHKGNILLHLS